MPRKNIMDLMGRPLISYTLDLRAPLSGDRPRRCFDRQRRDSRRRGEPGRERSVPEAGGAGNGLGCEDRRDSTRTEYVEEHEGFRPDIVVDLDISVPLRTPDDVAGCIDVMIATTTSTRR